MYKKLKASFTLYCKRPKGFSSVQNRDGLQHHQCELEEQTEYLVRKSKGDVQTGKEGIDSSLFIDGLINCVR